jgi:hypothetical protein
MEFLMTTLDLIGAIVLTASAAVLIFALALAQPDPPAGRVHVAAVLGGWFALIVAAGALHVFDNRLGLGTPGLGIAAAAPVILLAYAGLRSTAGQATLLNLPIPLLIGINAVRVLGVFFVLLYTQSRLPAPFAPEAGWGDIAIGLTALPVALVVLRQARGWRPIALIWNSLGLLDLVAAIGLGVASAEGSPIRVFFVEPSSALMGSLPWLLVPAFLVPLLMAMHLAVFYRLAAATRPSHAVEA